jgi:hypothetical protein
MIRRLLIAGFMGGLMAGCSPTQTPTPEPVSATDDAARVASWWHGKEPPHRQHARHYEAPQQPVPAPQEPAPACDLTGFKAGCETY